MELPIDLHYKPTREEIVRIARRFAFHHPLFWVLGAFTAVAGGVVMLGVREPKPGPLLALIFLLGLGSGIWLLSILIVGPARRWDSFRKVIGDSGLTYRISSTGIEVKADTIQARYDWSLFSHVSEDCDSFLVHPKDQLNYLILLKRSCSSPEMIELLRSTLKQRLRVW